MATIAAPIADSAYTTKILRDALAKHDSRIAFIATGDYDAVFVTLKHDLSADAALNVVSDLMQSKPDEFSTEGRILRLWWD